VGDLVCSYGSHACPGTIGQLLDNTTEATQVHPVPHVLLEFADRGDADRLPGEGLSHQLHDACRQHGFAVSEVDAWRDSGWCFRAIDGEQEFEVFHSAYGDGHLLLAIAPPDPPGLMARWRGKRAAPVGPSLRRIAQIVHETLEDPSEVSRARWMFNGPPEAVQQYASPDLLPWPDGE